MNKLTALSGMLALLCMQAAHADHTARFPEELRFTGINEGYAVVGWTVAPDGRIEDTIVLQASHPAFGKTALEALPKRLLWTQGAVLPRYDSAEFIFKQTGSIHSYSSTAEMIRQAKKEQRGTVPTATIAAADLPAPLEQTGTGTSVCPKSEQMLAGAATVRFVVDDQGKVRVPRIIDATSDEFALAMLSAIKQWHFSPPNVDGQRVQVEDTQAFIVNPTDACVVFKPTVQTQVAVR